MRSETAVGVTAAGRAREASEELHASQEKDSHNRSMAAILKVTQLAESRKERAQEAEAELERARRQGVDPDTQRQLDAAERVKAAATEKAESLLRIEKERPGALAGATLTVAAAAAERRAAAAARDASDNPERRAEEARRAEVAMGLKAYRQERESSAEKEAAQRRAAIVQRALEARQARMARESGGE